MATTPPTSVYDIIRRLIACAASALAADSSDKQALEDERAKNAELVAQLADARKQELNAGNPLNQAELDSLQAILSDAASASTEQPSAAPTLPQRTQRTMRAKLQVGKVSKYPDSNDPSLTGGVSLSMFAVAPDTYPADGSDENNSYAKWSPSASLSIYIANPNLFDSFEEGQRFYVDFTLAADRSQSVPPAPASESSPAPAPAPDPAPNADPGASPTTPAPASSLSDSASAPAAQESAAPAANPASGN